MKLLSVFSIGVFFALVACSVDPGLAGRYPVWMYAMFISSQLLVYAASSLRAPARMSRHRSSPRE